jgi:hypothetical protein
MKKPKEDPNKNTVAAPRNADGSVKKWIEGMAACKYCGEKHLHRDCTSEKAQEAAK